jgi:hypothetical protein
MMKTYRSPRTGHALFAAAAGMFMLTGCGEKAETPTPALAAPTPPAAAAQPTAAAPGAPAATQVAWQPAALDELLAPIALYPDALLGKILAASQDPQQVLDGGNWLLENQKLNGKALDEAAEGAGFGPQMRALFAFPDVVDMMCQNLDWTTQLGEAFGADQPAVLDSVQRLRTQAVNAGNFKTTPQQKVETQSVPAAGGGTKQVVVVEPAKPEVVYVPKYDPAAVYQPPPTTVVNNYGTAPATAAAPATAPASASGSSTNDALVGGLIGFGAGILIANAFNDDDDWDDYYRPAWGHGYPPMPPPPVYRPPYGYGGGAYNRPPNYVNAYNRPVQYGNTNVNINVDNNYFNRFPNNPSRPAAGAATRPATRAPTVGTTPASPSRVQGSYAGARPGGSAGIPNTVPRVPGQLNGNVPRPTTTAQPASRPSTSAANRPKASYAGAAGSTPRPTADRGYGGSPGKPAQASRAQPAPTTRPAPASGYATQPQSSTTSRPAPETGGAGRGGAFSGGGGNAERAAASRGRQSMGSGGGRRAR